MALNVLAEHGNMANVLIAKLFEIVANVKNGKALVPGVWAMATLPHLVNHLIFRDALFLILAHVINMQLVLIVLIAPFVLGVVVPIKLVLKDLQLQHVQCQLLHAHVLKIQIVIVVVMILVEVANGAHL